MVRYAYNFRKLHDMQVHMILGEGKKKSFNSLILNTGYLGVLKIVQVFL